MKATGRDLLPFDACLNGSEIFQLLKPSIPAKFDLWNKYFSVMT